MEKCKKWFGYKHSWSKWELTQTYQITDRFTGRELGEKMILKRFCETCGEPEVRSDKFYV